MAIQNKDFRVKNGLYVGTDIDVLRGAVSALSAHIGGGYGDTGVTISSIGDLSANGLGVFDGNVLIGGGYGDTGITLTSTGNLSANGDAVIDGNLSVGSFSTSVADTQIFYSNNGDLTGNAGLTFDGTTLRSTALSATTLSGSGTALTTNFTLSAGGDVDGATVNVTALNGTYSLNLELTNVLTTSAGPYGSQTSIPTFVVDEDGRLTSAANVPLATTLNTAGDSTTGDVDLLTETLSVIGTANEIETAASNNTITIGLPDDVVIGRNLTVTGDLLVSGDTTTLNVSSVLVEDPVIKLGTNNIADTVDIGFYGQYRVGTCGSESDNRYTGLIRDTSLPGISAAYVFFENTDTDLLSANATGDNAKPTVDQYANVYMGRLGINTSDFNADNRLTISGAISGDSTLTIDGATTLGGTLGVTGNVTIGGGFIGSIPGGITLTSTGNISADGGIYADAFYSITGNTAIDFNDNIDLDGTLTSTGSISGNSTLFIDGDATFRGAVTLGDASGDSTTIAGDTITLSNLPGATSNNVVIWDGSSNLGYDEIDSRVWGATLVDNNGASGTANRLTKWTDGDSVVDSRISDDATDVVIGVGGTNPVTFTASSSATSVTYNDTTGYHSLSTLVEMTCTNLPIFSKPATEFRSGKVIVQSVLGSTQYEVAELLLIHDGTDVHVTEYGNISTAATFCTSYSADINGGNVRILATNAHTTVDAVVTTAVQQFLI